MKKRINKKICSVFICLMLGAVMFVNAVFFAQSDVEQSDKTSSAKMPDMQPQDSGSDFSQHLLADGTAVMRMKEQEWDFSWGTEELMVQEVYVKAGSVVQEGEPILKLKKDGVEAVALYYEEAVENADETLSLAQLALEKGILEAETARMKKQTTAQHATEKYEAAIGSIEAETEEKYAAYEEAVEEIQTLQTALDQGTYYIEVQINEKQEAVDRTEAEYIASEQALSLAQSTYEQAKAECKTMIITLQQQIEADAGKETLLQTAQQIAVLSDHINAETVNVANAVSMKEQKAADRDKAKQTFDSAVKEYNNKVEQTNTKIEELTESLDGLLKEYEQAKRDAVTKKEDVENEYRQAVLAGEYADTEYQASLLELTNAVDEAKKQLEILQEEQSLFLTLKDGILLAQSSGTLAEVNYEAGDTVREEVAAVSYYNEESVWISVEIPQEHIAEIAVGDSVTVQTEQMRRGLTGTVSSVASAKTSGGSMSDVTYAVEIMVDNTDKRLETGTAVTVKFGGKDENVEKKN